MSHASNYHASPSQANQARTCERSKVPETDRRDARSNREVQPALTVHLCLRRGEKRLPEPQGDRSSNDRQMQVKQVCHRCHCPSYKDSGALDHRSWSFTGRPSSHRLYRAA